MPNLSLMILGASGDLTKRLLMPSLFRLHKLGLIPKLNIIGYSIDKWDRDAFLKHIHDALQQFIPGFNEADWASF